MEIRQSMQRFPTGPIVLVLVMLSVLALALTSWYVVTSNRPVHVVSGPAVSTGLGPDAATRNDEIINARGERQSKAEQTHGH